MAIELVDVCNFRRGDVFVTHKMAAVRDFIYTFRFDSANSRTTGARHLKFDKEIVTYMLCMKCYL
jgi:hypothetical protein